MHIKHEEPCSEADKVLDSIACLFRPCLQHTMLEKQHRLASLVVVIVVARNIYQTSKSHTLVTHTAL